MSTGYLILYYKNNIIESYVRNFLMTKYISLNNAIGSNELISKIKYSHRNYFCFINKENHSVRCIIKLNKITNHQIDLKIKSQQEIALNDLKKTEIFKSESAMLDNFFNLDINTDLNYLNNKFNLIIKESNNIYEFNCILLEDPIDMGIFEKIKKCMKDKENVHNNEIQHNLRNNPFMSSIFSYQAAFGKKNLEEPNKCTYQNIGESNLAKNGKNDENFFDMKYNKYFLYDELLIDKNENKDENKLFNKNKIKDYIELNNKFKPILKISNIIFSKPFSELDDVNDEINLSEDDSKYNGNKMIDIEDPNINKENTENINNQMTKEENNVINRYNDYPVKNIINRTSNISNNISLVKEESQMSDRYKRTDSYNNYSNLYLKKEQSNNSFKSYDNNSNYFSSNGGYKYYNKGDMNNSNNINSGESNKYEKFERRNNFRDSNPIRNSYNTLRRKDSYGNRSNDNMKNYSNNNFSYHSSNSSYNSEKGRNYERSRDRTPKKSPESNNRYNRGDSPRQKSSYDKYNDRNNINKNNNYYGDNNNINYYYNINNYYRPGNMSRWNEGNFYQKRDSFQRNKNDYYNNNNYYNNHEGHYFRQRRRGNQGGGY